MILKRCLWKSAPHFSNKMFQIHKDIIGSVQGSETLGLSPWAEICNIWDAWQQVELITEAV